jgi:hypothetical protein
MPTLVGENFKLWAKNQVDLRQSLLGNKNTINNDKQSEVLTWMTNQTSWLRVSSAINITSSSSTKKTDKDISKNLTGEEKYIGRELARNYILYGGVVRLSENFVGIDISKSPIFRGGVSNTVGQSYINNFAYEHNTDIGIVPMPGVESLSIQTLNNGAIRKASFKVIAHSPQQFRIIDALYMRPGYTILIEWGHTLYFTGTKDNPIYTKANYYTPAFNQIMTPVVTPQTKYYNVLDSIKRERKETEGNYDGFLGRVTTWEWDYKDGIYNITINAVSMGDIIESLNITRLSATNASSPSIGSNSSTIKKPSTSTPSKTASKNTSTPQNSSAFHRWLYEIHETLYAEITKNKNTQKKKIYTNSKNEITIYSTGLIQTTDNINIEDDKKNYLAIKSTSSPSDQQEKIGGITIGGQEKAAINLPFAYIKFKYLLHWLNAHANIKDSSNENTPYISISTDPCFIYTNPYVYSINPNICIIPFNTPKFEGDDSSIKIEKDKSLPIDKTYWNEILDPYSIKGLPYKVKDEESETEEEKKYTGDFVGDLMEIYININIVFSLLDKNQQNGGVFMLSFLNNICNEIEKALGNVNELSVSFDSDENKVFFYDNVPLDEAFYEAFNKNYKDRVAKFNILGPKKDKKSSSDKLLYDGSFIRDLGIKSLLSPSLGSLIFMSAQNPNNANSLAASSGLSKLSEGFTDCLALDKLAIEALAENKTEVTQKAQYEKLNTGIINTFYTKANTIKTDDIVSQTLIQGVLFKNITNKIGAIKGIIPTAFIPFNLNFDMDGFSGPKIFQKFDINKEILPYNYPENLKFIIKSLNHTIDSNGWVTSIDSFTAIKSA